MGLKNSHPDGGISSELAYVPHRLEGSHEHSRRSRFAIKIMRKKSSSESGAFNPRILVAFLLCSVGAMLAMVSLAATPPNGTLSDTVPTLTYTAGPFFQANQSPVGVGQLDSGPRCDSLTFPCDNYALTITLPAGYAAAHPNASAKVTMSWTDGGSGQSDYDLYVFKNPRSDCTPNDCTTPDGSEAADYNRPAGATPR